jgi:hypothetical protein
MTIRWINEIDYENETHANAPDVLIDSDTGLELVQWLGGDWIVEGSDPKSKRFKYHMRNGDMKFQHEMVEEDVRVIVDVDDWADAHWECLTLNAKEKMVLLLRGEKYEVVQEKKEA